MTQNNRAKSFQAPGTAITIKLSTGKYSTRAAEVLVESRRKPERKMTIVRSVAQLAVIAIVLRSGCQFVSARLEDDGACPLFVLLPLTSTYVVPY